MTLIVVIPTKKSLILAADKRSDDWIRGVQDSRTKIVQAGSHFAVAATGHPDLLDDLTFLPLFDVKTIAKQFIETVGFPNEETDGMLHEQIITAFRMVAVADSACLLLLFAYSADSAGFPAGRTYVIPLKREGLFHVDTRIETFPNAKPCSFGNISVAIEIQQGRDPRFDDLRADKRIRRFYIDCPSRNEIEEEEAVEMCRFLITESSKREPLIESEYSAYPIGPTMDIARIEPGVGFSWLYRDENKQYPYVHPAEMYRPFNI